VRIRRALVTGGGGFIGSTVVHELLREGVEVVVLDNFCSGHRGNLEGLPVSLHEADVRTADAVADAMAGCDAVFHLAASVGNARSIAHPIDDATTNVLGTLNVLESARRHGVRRLVYSSSAGIFGELKLLPIREDHPVEPDSPYGATKLAGEKLCLSYAKLYPMQCVCLRYFNVYGERQRYDAYGNVIPIFMHRLLAGEPLIVYGDGEQTRDFVNSADVARANWLAASAATSSGAFNVASGSRVTINELVRLLKEASGLDPEVRHAEPRAGDVRHSIADVSAAGRAFGYSPVVALEPGLAAYFGWARANGL
jgi:UDP-glucose 4-epimerase